MKNTFFYLLFFSAAASLLGIPMKIGKISDARTGTDMREGDTDARNSRDTEAADGMNRDNTVQGARAVSLSVSAENNSGKVCEFSMSDQELIDDNNNEILDGDGLTLEDFKDALAAYPDAPRFIIGKEEASFSIHPQDEGFDDSEENRSITKVLKILLQREYAAALVDEILPPSNSSDDDLPLSAAKLNNVINLKTCLETNNLTQYTWPQAIFSKALRTHWVCRSLLKISLRPTSYASLPISKPAFRIKALEPNCSVGTDRESAIRLVSHQEALPADSGLVSRNISSILFRPLISLGSTAGRVALRVVRAITSGVRIYHEHGGDNELIANRVMAANRSLNRNDPRSEPLLLALIKGHDYYIKFSGEIQRIEEISSLFEKSSGLGTNHANRLSLEARAQLQKVNEALYDAGTRYDAAQASNLNV